MELTINVSALDKTNSAVVSTSDRTPVGALEMLTLGNVEPVTVAFCNNDGAVPAWVTDADTTVAIGIGRPAVDGGSSYTSSDLTVSGNTRVGSINLDTDAIRTMLFSCVCCNYCGRRGVWLLMEIRRVTTVNSVVTAAESVALLQVFIALPVLAYN